MSLVKDPVGQAARVRTLTRAARLHQSLEAELALNAYLPLSWTEEAEQAIRDLERRFDREALREPESVGGNNGWLPSLSPAAKKGLDAEIFEETGRIDWAGKLSEELFDTRWRRPLGIAAAVITITCAVIVALLIVLAAIGLITQLFI